MRQTLDNVAKVLKEAFHTNDAISFNNVKHGNVPIDINPNTRGFVEANLKTTTPNILVFVGDNVILELTWEDARRFSSALEEVTDVAEFG